MAISAELRNKVQAMIDAGEPEEKIRQYIRDITAPEGPKQPTYSRTAESVPKNEPGSFWKGVGKSFTSGEALGTGLQGLKGWGTGAILDLPRNVVGGVTSILDMAFDPDRAAKFGEAIKGIPAGLRAIDETFTKAGSDPEAFGELMGNMSQPGVIEELGPPALQKLGAFEKRWAPASRMPFMWGIRPIERFAGKKLEDIGKALTEKTYFGRPAASTGPTVDPYSTRTGSNLPPRPSTGASPGRMSLGPNRPTGTSMKLAEPEPFLRTQPSASEQFSTKGITPPRSPEFPKEVNIPIKEGQIVRKPLNVGGINQTYGPGQVVTDKITGAKYFIGIDENGQYFIKPTIK